MLSTVKTGVSFGLREAFQAPTSLFRIRKRLLKSASRGSKGHSTDSDSSTQAYYDQALHRQRVSAAMGEKRPSSRPTDTPSRSSFGSSFSSSADILRPLCRIWLINFLVVLAMAGCLRVFSLTLYTRIGRFFWSFSIVQWILSLLFSIMQTFAFLIMEIVNSVFLKSICVQITVVRQRHSAAGNRNTYLDNSSSNPKSISSFGPASGLSVKVIDYTYSVVFFIACSLQWKIIAALVPFAFVKFIIKCFSLSFIYACYAFDYYARFTSDVTVEIFLIQVTNYWPVFIGYGLPLGVLVSLTLKWFWISDLLICFFYPIMVIGAFQISWSKALDPSQHRVPQYLRNLAVLFLQPALLATNVFISVTASVGRFFMFRK
ncbi:hypothetical protein Aperf_G00000071355 [Anoplocephala perfoliata]